MQRELAVRVMQATPLPGQCDWMKEAGRPMPVPLVPGSIGAVARECFSARELLRPYDLLVAFTIGDFTPGKGCSSYFDPKSPWYNVFYGAYGVRSYKQDGAAWGFHPDGSVHLEELCDVPRLDYNFLTAGRLGCPPSRMCFRLEEVTQGRQGDWHYADVHCVIPSGLHRAAEAVSPSMPYYLVFGRPDDGYLAGGRPSYEPVAMRGRMYFRAIAERTTLVWGGLMPRTPEGQRLLDTVLEAMAPLYLR